MSDAVPLDRASTAPVVLPTQHGDLILPCFLPDATRATVRGVDPHDLHTIGIDGVVVNTFHLLRSPGTRLIKLAGGIHQFMGWNRPVISDSGGFQVYSLIRQDPNAGVIRPNEVIFREPTTGERIILSPEKCIHAQLQLGSDVLFCLDDCTDAEDDLDEQRRAVDRTIRWATRCREVFDTQVSSPHREPITSTPFPNAVPRQHEAKVPNGDGGDRPSAVEVTNGGQIGVGAVGRLRPNTLRSRRTREPRGIGSRPALFAVVQGGGSASLRRDCAQALAAIGFDGFGYGGWPLTPDGSLRVDMLGAVAEALPAGVPLHALGIGRPDHIVRAHALGYTIFDCTLPTRDARQGRLYRFLPGYPSRRPRPDEDFFEAHYVVDQKHANDFGPIDETCDCPTCARYSRAYVRHLFKVGDAVAWRLATLHNLRFYARLLESLRNPTQR